MISQRTLVIFVLMTSLVVLLAGGAATAQQSTPPDIWQFAPSDSLLVAGVDWRPSNPSIQAMTKAEDQQTRDALAKQQVALRKGFEDLSLLFGISLDFTKDIESWEGRQWAFVALPEGKKSIQPVFMLASTDAEAANAALQKMLAPMERVGQIIPQADTDYPMTAFKTEDKDVEVYASAFGPLVAFSPSKDALKHVLATVHAVPYEGPVRLRDREIADLSGSMMYVFADPALLKRLDVRELRDVPLTGAAMGMSVLDTGPKIQAFAYLTPQQVASFRMLLPEEKMALSANPGIPSNSLVVGTLPSLKGLTAMAGMFGAMAGGGDSWTTLAQALSDAQVSMAITAALPTPSGVIAAAAPNEQEAAEKLMVITASLKRMHVGVKPAKTIGGITVTPLKFDESTTMLLAQIGNYVVIASDAQSLTATAATIQGQKPPVAASKLYKETIANLDHSNIATVYANLAPMQGLGYLIDGFGVAQVQPIYGAAAKSLEGMQSMGIGVGFDGDTVSATMFLRANPQMTATTIPVALSSTFIGAAMLFPMLGEMSTPRQDCSDNMRELAQSAMSYSQCQGRLPSRTKWQQQLEEEGDAPSEFTCPDGDSAYAFNKNLGDLRLTGIKNPAEVVMFFEADANLAYAAGSRADAKLPHDGCGWFAFADGHVESLDKVPDQSHWVPKYAEPKPVKKVPVKKRAVKHKSH